MKKIFSLVMLFLFSFFMLNSVAFAEEVIIPTQDFIMFLLQSVGEIKGASTLSISYSVVQVLVKFMSSELWGSWFKKVSGATKITVVLVLTLASGILGLMTAGGLPFGAALLHSSTLAAFSVLANQLYKQYAEKVD